MDILHQFKWTFAIPKSWCMTKIAAHFSYHSVHVGTWPTAHQEDLAALKLGWVRDLFWSGELREIWSQFWSLPASSENTMRMPHQARVPSESHVKNELLSANTLCRSGNKSALGDSTAVWPRLQLYEPPGERPAEEPAAEPNPNCWPTQLWEKGTGLLWALSLRGLCVVVDNNAA